MNIGIYIYDQAEVLDFSGPFEVFTTASRVSGEEAPFSVFLIAEQDGPELPGRATRCCQMPPSIITRPLMY